MVEGEREGGRERGRERGKEGEGREMIIPSQRDTVGIRGVATIEATEATTSVKNLGQAASQLKGHKLNRTCKEGPATEEPRLMGSTWAEMAHEMDSLTEAIVDRARTLTLSKQSTLWSRGQGANVGMAALLRMCIFNSASVKMKL